jgi:hypothetical protein
LRSLQGVREKGFPQCYLSGLAAIVQELLCNLRIYWSGGGGGITVSKGRVVHGVSQ